MRGRNAMYRETVTEPYENQYLRDDFELDDLVEDDEVVTVYDVDTVLGYTVDILKVGYPLLFLIALVLSLIFMFGWYF